MIKLNAKLTSDNRKGEKQMVGDIEKEIRIV